MIAIGAQRITPPPLNACPLFCNAEHVDDVADGATDADPLSGSGPRCLLRASTPGCYRSRRSSQGADATALVTC